MKQVNTRGALLFSIGKMVDSRGYDILNAEQVDELKEVCIPFQLLHYVSESMGESPAVKPVSEHEQARGSLCSRKTTSCRRKSTAPAHAWEAIDIRISWQGLCCRA